MASPEPPEDPMTDADPVPAADADPPADAEQPLAAAAAAMTRTRPPTPKIRPGAHPPSPPSSDLQQTGSNA